MKTKLLKKIRKRFEIIHYPQGWNFGEHSININNKPCVILYDHKNDSQIQYLLSSRSIHNAFNSAKEYILYTIRKEYKKKYEIKESKKLWYNESSN